MRKILTILSLVGVALVAFTGTSLAAENADQLGDLARPVLDAVMHGQYWLAASLALVLAVAMFKRYAPGKYGAFARSDVGGATLVLAGAFGGALATALAAGGAISLSLAWVALKVAIGAAGGYSLLKKLAAPALAVLASRAPAWAAAPLRLLLWVLGKPDPVAEAEAAGAKAVKLAPAKGIEGIVGKSRDAS